MDMQACPLGSLLAGINGLKEPMQKGFHMSKYDTLWEYIRNHGSESFKLTFAEIEEIAGIPIDHSFLKYKKELLESGYQVGKISMKEQTVVFSKIEKE